MSTITHCPACCEALVSQRVEASSSMALPAFELFVLAVIFHFRRFNSASVVVKTGAIVKLFSHTAILSIVPAATSVTVDVTEACFSCPSLMKAASSFIFTTALCKTIVPVVLGKFMKEVPPDVLKFTRFRFIFPLSTTTPCLALPQKSAPKRVTSPEKPARVVRKRVSVYVLLWSSRATTWELIISKPAGSSAS